MNETGFQTGLSDSNNTQTPKCWSTATGFVSSPQLLKLIMACRIPSDSLTLPDTKNEEYLQILMVSILTHVVSDTLLKFTR